MASIFDTLVSINVNDRKEKKNGLDYLSWAYAWAEVKKVAPDATYTVYERETEYGPVFYFTDGRTCWVKTGVTINGVEHIEYLPVMDRRNQSIPLENVTSMNVNTAIQRSITKACARHGLGLYIYAGEDLPEDIEGDTSPEAAEGRSKASGVAGKESIADKRETPDRGVSGAQTRNSDHVVCERCGKIITGIALPGGTTMTASEVVGRSKLTYGGCYCYECSSALKAARAKNKGA